MKSKKHKPVDLRAALRAAMGARGINQTALKKLSGVPQSNISDFLGGKTELTTATYQRLLRALDFEMDNHGQLWSGIASGLVEPTDLV